MSWQTLLFWKKSEGGLPGPKHLPHPVGRDIVVKLGGNPELVWVTYKAVTRPQEGMKDTFEVRVFHPDHAASQKITIKDYNSLTEHPELILYEGWFNKTAQAEIKKRK